MSIDFTNAYNQSEKDFVKEEKNESLKIKVNCTHLENVIKAFKIANNAIYFDDSSDYLVALYDVCKALKPDINVDWIGTKYLEE